MPRNYSVSDIKSRLLKPALTSHYEVYIRPPEVARRTIEQNRFSERIEETLTLSCSDASLPGSNLVTHELNNDFTGVTQRHAYRRVYDDRADFSFYVNHEYDQIRYFEAWMRYISGEQVSESESTTNYYRVRYPKQYKSPKISITKFERNLGSKEKANSMVYNFINAFPISVSSMPVSYESSQLLKVTVSFSYDRYVAGNILTNQPSEFTSSGVPNNPFQLTPQYQAQINSAFTQNINLGNFSSETFTNTDFSGVFNQSDPTRVFQQTSLNQTTQTAFSGNQLF